MFSGIIEETGKVVGAYPRENLTVLKVRARKILPGIKPGSSVSVNGACLTVTAVGKGFLSFDIMKETLSKTALGNLKIASPVNLERALKANGRIDGHLVTGHVDAVAGILAKITGPNYTEFRISIPRGMKSYFVPKGSVCLDGVSLSIGEVKKSYFSVYLIPYTLEKTTLGMKTKGDRVNIETDIVAKYLFSKR